jgi:hypothetical protein
VNSGIKPAGDICQKRAGHSTARQFVGNIYNLVKAQTTGIHENKLIICY